MINLSKQLNAIVSKSIQKSFPLISNRSNIIKNPTGYTILNGVQISSAKSVNLTTSEICSMIIQNIESNDIISNCSVNEKGYIGLTLSNEYISSCLQRFECKWPTIPNKKVIVDFSSPNIAKEMHVGHLRSSIIGDSVSRILEFCNYNVLRLNHVGDWGTQFGMLIEMIRNSGQSLENMNISDLEVLYKQSKDRFDKDEIFKKAAQERVVLLQQGDKETLENWRIICRVSRVEYQKIYDELDIKLTERGESFYNPMIPETLKEVDSHTVLSDGAKCLFVPKFENPLMLTKSDGGYTYDTTDIVALKHRLFVEEGDWLIYITDMGQRNHFDMIFGAGKLLNWIQPIHRVDHLGFGVVLGEDHKKFKTRSGTSIKLMSLISEAKERVFQSIRMRSEVYTNEDEMRSAADILGKAAIKYADLKNNMTSNYVFSFDKMLDLKGNTAMYLMYAYVRIVSIVKKSGKTTFDGKVQILHQTEVKLALHLLRFSEVIETILEKLQPHLLCDYLYELSIVFNEFHRDCKVIGDPYESSRLNLCNITQIVMKQGFDLLGIQVINKL